MGTPYHSSKLHPGPCSSVGMRRRTDRHTDARDHTFRVVYDSREINKRSTKVIFCYHFTVNIVLVDFCYVWRQTVTLLFSIFSPSTPRFNTFRCFILLLSEKLMQTRQSYISLHPRCALPLLPTRR